MILWEETETILGNLDYKRDMIYNIKGNDTLRGDGNYVLLFFKTISTIIKGNDTLRGDGNKLD